MTNSRTRRAGLLAVCAAIVAAAASITPARAVPAAGAILGAGDATAIGGSYIVVLRDAAVTAGAVPAKAHSLADRYGGTIGHTYTDALHGFEINLPEQAARRLAGDPAVDYVQANQTMSLTSTESPVPSWGLDRIDQRALPLDDSYTYPNTGAGVKAYVIDSGINLTHSDFGGRALSGRDVVSNDDDATDCYGHGTHVAGTIGGTTYGVAKNATLVAVRVANCSGSLTSALVIAGIDWATADHTTGPAVANLSMGGSANKALDAAVAHSIADGITYAVAAGNLFGSDACAFSPSRTPNAVTVGATTSTDARPGYSNIGSCLDLFAPGSDITSTWIGSDTATNISSGTSMAAPHVAGAAALVLAANPGFTPQQVRDQLVDNATPNVVTNAGTGSPNRLLHIAESVRQ
jgi:subtilisin family serine protease